MNTLLRSLLLLILIGAGIPALAQDTTRQDPPATTQNLDSDSIIVTKNGKVMTIESYAARYNPRKALLYAAVLPGAGQVYNKKYWKLPLVYGGFAGLGFGVAWNQGNYAKYRKGLFNLLNDKNYVIVDPATGTTANGNVVINGNLYFPVGDKGRLSLEVLRTAVNKYRRDRDYMLIMSFIFYMMQMIDAHVDAHLKEFDLNPQLKVSIEPTMNQNVSTGRSAGVGLTLKF